jgi:hypothetical protein
MVAAEEIGCTPWELEQQPIYWRERALVKRQAESEAEYQRGSTRKQFEETRKQLGS